MCVYMWYLYSVSVSKLIIWRFLDHLAWKSKFQRSVSLYFMGKQLWEPPNYMLSKANLWYLKHTPVSLNNLLSVFWRWRTSHKAIFWKLSEILRGSQGRETPWSLFFLSKTVGESEIREFGTKPSHRCLLCSDTGTISSQIKYLCIGTHLKE